MDRRDSIVLGGANIGSSIELSGEALSRLLVAARSKGINKLDLSLNYSEALSALEPGMLEGYQVHLKCGKVDEQLSDTQQRIENFVSRHPEAKLESISFHDSRVVLDPVYLQEVDSWLCELLSKGNTEAIGYSVYNPLDVYSLIEILGAEKKRIIQIPINILDGRLDDWNEAFYLSSFAGHARSIFLKGLLVDPTIVEEHSWGAHPAFIDYYLWLKEHKLDGYEACLGFVFSLPFVERVIFGVRSIFDLPNQVPNRSEMSCFDSVPKTRCEDILDPRRWS